MRTPRILVDCDCVLADYVAATFDVIESITGTRHIHEDVDGYDVIKGSGNDHLRERITEIRRRFGWCQSMQPIEFSREAIAQLSELGRVVVVTAPDVDHPTWAYERFKWLNTTFGFSKRDIVSTHAKELVDGDVFVDDNVDNCVAWHKEHPGRLTLLWDMPHNRHFKHDQIVRCLGWGTVILHVTVFISSLYPQEVRIV